MIMTVEELRQFISTDETDPVLETKLNALELMVKGYTNNPFTRALTETGEYPADVKIGVVNLLKWELNNREKVGVQSESVSRHTVQYFDMGRDNSEMSYPVSLLGFLQPYCRARFGQGVED